uniref:Transposase n=1 Tax=Bradyrhizobium quebecense TaxID=2748629 RepID=A0ABS3MVG9_9BRAD
MYVRYKGGGVSLRRLANAERVVSAATERYRSAKRGEKGRILDELCATTGWHRKHAVRALRRRETVGSGKLETTRKRRRRYGATIKDALTALWEASDRVCGKRLKVMIPTSVAQMHTAITVEMLAGSKLCPPQASVSTFSCQQIRMPSFRNNPSIV